MAVIGLGKMSSASVTGDGGCEGSSSSSNGAGEATEREINYTLNAGKDDEEGEEVDDDEVVDEEVDEDEIEDEDLEELEATGDCDVKPAVTAVNGN